MNEAQQAMADLVRSAFADAVARPSPPMALHRRDTSFTASIERAFAESPGQPTFDLLSMWTLQSNLLQPEVERWLWRALLLQTLETSWEPHADWRHPEHDAVGRLLHTTVYGLRANPCAVLDGRTDFDSAQNLRARLNRQQRTAISGVLGLILQDPLFTHTIYGHRASQSIRWCWTHDRESKRAAVAHFAALRDYSRPTDADRHNEALIQSIERVFAHTPVPVGPLMKFRSEEPDEYVLDLQGVRWQQLSPQLVNYNSPAFSYMSPEAFRYFIPAAMCHAIGPGCEVDVLFHVVDCLLEGTEPRHDAHDTVQVFSNVERQVIVNFIKHKSEGATDPHQAAATERALQLWRVASNTLGASHGTE